MKKKFFLMSLMASLFMVGCTQEDIVPNEGNGDVATNNGETRTSYLSVNLVSENGTGSRAAAGYEDGTEEENKVKSVRFYFFTQTGEPANVKLLTINGESKYVNYYDWIQNIEQKDDKDGDDIESILSATIVISTKEGDKLPQTIAAVLNPSAEVLGTDSRTLTSLRSVRQNYAKRLATDKTFVMYNSVYADGDAEINTTFITSDNLATSEDLAKTNPVKIHVERNVAKVKVVLTNSIGFDEQGKLALQDSKGENLKIEDKQVYLKISDWSLTAESNNCGLVKDINPKWEGSWWNGPSYTDAALYRSFWAKNTPTAINQYYDYNAIKSAITSSNYTNENAEDYDAENPIKRTKVILKGTLYDEDGKEFTIVRHLGAYFGDNPANFNNLKKSILAQLKANHNNSTYYRETQVVEGDETKMGKREIDENDIEIVVVEQKQQEDSDNNCKVCAQLIASESEETVKWYDSNSKDAVALENGIDVINTDLKTNIAPALVWNSGMTYYYYEILHKGIGTPVTTIPGVVRNHIYDTRVTKIAGLGTPVYDPNQIIYPEHPKDNDHYIAAEIDILSWRIVRQDYDLVW